MKPRVVLLLLASACSQPSTDPAAPDAPEGDCAYRNVEMRCRLADVAPGRANSDDADAVALTVRYEGLPTPGVPALDPWTKVHTLPSPRIEPVTAHYRAHAEVACVAELWVRGGCPPHNRVLEVRVPEPPLVAPHPAVATVILAAPGSPPITLTSAQGVDFERAVLQLEQHGFFEGDPTPAPPADAPTITVRYADQSTRVIADLPAERARFEACKRAIRQELPQLAAPWGMRQ